jgi:hypothetical protein
MDYKHFLLKNPALEDYEAELSKFASSQKDIESLSSIHIISVLSLNTKSIKMQLGKECVCWKLQVST